MTRVSVLTLSIALVVGAGALVAGCSKKSPNGNNGPGSNVPTSNPNGGGTGNNTSSNNNQNKSISGINIDPRNSSLTQGTSGHKLNISVIFTDSSSQTVSPADTTITSSDTNLVTVDDANDTISVSTTGTGKVNLVVKVVLNGETKEQTYTDAVEVLASSSGTGNGGGSNPGGSTGGNQIPSTDLIQSITPSVTGNADANVGFPIGVVNTHEDGNTSNNKGLVFGWVNEVDRLKVSVDADLNVFFRNHNDNATVNLLAISKNTGHADPQEFWNKVVTATQAVASGPTAASSGLWISCPGFISIGEVRQLTVIDLSNGNDVTSACTFSIDDATKAEMVNDLSGNATRLRGKNVLGSNGTNSYFTLTVSHNGQQQTFKSRVIVGNPVANRSLDTNGNFIEYVYDTHIRVGFPYVISATKAILPILCNLQKPDANNKPAWFGPPDYETNDPLPGLDVFLDASGNKWGLHKFELDIGTGNINVAPFQFVGFWTSPIVNAEFSDPDKWKFPADITQSFYFDTHTFQQGGQTKTGTDFLIQIRRIGDPNNGNLFNPNLSFVTRWDKN